MTNAECEIVADIGQSLRNIKDDALHMWEATNEHRWLQVAMRAAELYGGLAVLPLTTEPDDV